MKKILMIAALVGVGGGLFYLGYSTQNLSLLFHKPRLLARVNGIDITDENLKQELLFLKVSPDATFSDSTQEDVLNRLINNALILQEANRLKVMVPEAAVNSRLAASWEGYEPAEVRRIMRDNRISPAAWRRLIRNQLLVEAAIQQVVENRVRVSDEEVDSYYWAHLLEFYQPARVHARQIVVDTLAQAQAIKAKLDGGEDFLQLAEKYSRGPERDQGGDLGWVAQTDLPQAFSQALFKLAPGQVSDPVSTEYGFHLFRVDGKESGGKMPVEEAKRKIAQDLKLEKVDQAFQAWVEALRSPAKIIINDLRGAE